MTHYKGWVADPVIAAYRFDSLAKIPAARTSAKNWTIVSENPVKYRVEVVAPKQKGCRNTVTSGIQCDAYAVFGIP